MTSVAAAIASAAWLPIAACGSPQPLPAPTEPEPAPGPRPAADVAPPPSLKCPDGATRIRAPLPERAIRCQRPDGRRHGAFAELHPDGSVEVLGTYRNDQLDGAWVRMRPDRRITE